MVSNKPKHPISKGPSSVLFFFFLDILRYTPQRNIFTRIPWDIDSNLQQECHRWQKFWKHSSSISNGVNKLRCIFKNWLLYHGRKECILAISNKMDDTPENTRAWLHAVCTTESLCYWGFTTLDKSMGIINTALTALIPFVTGWKQWDTEWAQGNFKVQGTILCLS